MKRLTALLMSAILLMSLLSGCGNDTKKDTDSIPSTVTTTTTAAESAESTTGTTESITTTDTTGETTTTTTVITTTTTTVTTKPQSAAKLGGVSLSEYVIVYDNDAPDYTFRAVGYICEEVQNAPAWSWRS